MKRQSMIAYGTALEETEATTPAPQGKEVLVRISHCGVCHSDLHIHDGHFDLGGGKQLDIKPGRALPFTLGHEIAGTVEAKGPEAAGIEIGGRYAVYPWIGCGRCARCREGEEHLCDAPRQLGINIDGGYASHVLVPDARYLIDATGIAPELAGSYMCSGLTAYSALKKALPYAAGGSILIVGLGGVGMMGLQIARAVFEGPLLVADIDARKREAALEAGAAHAFDPAAEDARKSVFKTAGAPAAAVDFVGSEGSLNFASGVLRKGGAVIVAGLLGGCFSIPVPMLPLRAISIHGNYVGPLGDARELVEMVRAGKVKAIPVRTRSLAEANAALGDLRAGRVMGRVVLTP